MEKIVKTHAQIQNWRVRHAAKTPEFVCNVLKMRPNPKLMVYVSAQKAGKDLIVTNQIRHVTLYVTVVLLMILQIVTNVQKMPIRILEFVSVILIGAARTVQIILETVPSDVLSVVDLLLMIVLTAYQMHPKTLAQDCVFATRTGIHQETVPSMTDSVGYYATRRKDVPMALEMINVTNV